jgi:hypothetical protein
MRRRQKAKNRQTINICFRKSFNLFEKLLIIFIFSNFLQIELFPAKVACKLVNFSQILIKKLSVRNTDFSESGRSRHFWMDALTSFSLLDVSDPVVPKSGRPV